MWRMHYFVDVCRLLQFAAVLRMRCATAWAGEAARIARFGARTVAAASRASPCEALATSSRRRPRRSARNGCSRMVRVAAAARGTARDGPCAASGSTRPSGGARPGPGARVGRGDPDAAGGGGQDRSAGLRIADSAPPRVNVLVPTIDLRALLRRLHREVQPRAATGRAGHRVRIFTVDPVGPLPRVAARLEGYGGLGGCSPRSRWSSGASRRARGQPRGHVHRDDLVDRARRARGGDASGPERFVYLIQEYEPFTFPMGTTRRSPPSPTGPAHGAVLLGAAARVLPPPPDRRLRRRTRRAAGRRSRSRTRSPRRLPAAAELACARPRRLLFYARPEPHAARNMFESACSRSAGRSSAARSPAGS